MLKQRQIIAFDKQFTAKFDSNFTNANIKHNVKNLKRSNTFTESKLAWEVEPGGYVFLKLLFILLLHV